MTKHVKEEKEDEKDDQGIFKMHGIHRQIHTSPFFYKAMLIIITIIMILIITIIIIFGCKLMLNVNSPPQPGIVQYLGTTLMIFVLS